MEAPEVVELISDDKRKKVSNDLVMLNCEIRLMVSFCVLILV